jgi:predicted MFS family arabinose efflux permease
MSSGEAAPLAAAPGFSLPGFIVLATLAGATIGMGNVITTLFAVHLGASAFQIGLIAGAATLGKMAVTLPAGYLIARFGARRVYLIATINCIVVYLAAPWLTVWSALAAARGLVGASVPFRTISMSATFLSHLRDRGPARAGLHRAAQSSGMVVIGPWLGAVLTGSANFVVAYGALAGMFALMAVWSQRLLPEAQSGEQPVAGENYLSGLLGLLRDGRVADSCLAEFATSSAAALFSSFILVLALTELHFSKPASVALLTAQGLASIGALFALGPAIARVPETWSYAGALAGLTLGLSLLGLGAAWPVLIAGAVALATGAAAIHLVTMRRLAASDASRSRVSSLLALSGQAGSLLGSVGGGALTGLIGLQSVYLAWIPLIWAAAAFSFWLGRRRSALGAAP